MEKSNRTLDDKKLLFEYLVNKLDEWRENIKYPTKDIFTKLRLQKILFFVCTINADEGNHKLLDVFNEFYALPYGPVEIDIYNCMGNNSFTSIKFQGNLCVFDAKKMEFGELDDELKEFVDSAIAGLKETDTKYLTCPVFNLVDLSHRWSAWQIAMRFAKFVGGHKAKLATEDILGSTRFF